MAGIVGVAMSEMVERVARAIYWDNRLSVHDPETGGWKVLQWEDVRQSERDIATSAARAAIAAMREPNDAMLVAGEKVNEWEDWDNDGGCTGGTILPLSAWQAMIDAALGEDGK